MKALSIVAPNGARIAEGLKTLEIRRWSPDLSPSEDLLIVENRRFLHAEGETDAEGRAVALVRVAGWRPFAPADIPAACASAWEPGWLAWELTAIRPLTPFPASAARGIYRIDLPPARDDLPLASRADRARRPATPNGERR